MLINYKGKNSNITVKKPGRHHFITRSKLTAQLMTQANIYLSPAVIH